MAEAKKTTCKSFAPFSRQITMPAPHHSLFTGQMPFLMPKKCQSTEDKNIRKTNINIMCAMINLHKAISSGFQCYTFIHMHR